jgi:hypothetical protein
MMYSYHMGMREIAFLFIVQAISRGESDGVKGDTKNTISRNTRTITVLSYQLEFTIYLMFTLLEN